jgi:hypothetical protein
VVHAKEIYETERKGANRTGLEIERMAQDRTSGVSFFLPYVPLDQTGTDDDNNINSFEKTFQGN